MIARNLSYTSYAQLRTGHLIFAKRGMLTGSSLPVVISPQRNGNTCRKHVTPTATFRRKTTGTQVQNLKKSEVLISQELMRITTERQASQSKKEQDSGIQQKDKPSDISISLDFIFESIDVMTGQNTISPGHINMLSQTHPTLDHRLRRNCYHYRHEIS